LPVEFTITEMNKRYCKMRAWLKNILFCLILLCIAQAIGFILRPRQNDVCLDQISTFHKLDNNSIDVIAYGSSHCWFGFDTNEFEKETGLSTYNYACYYQSINTTELFFDDSLRSQSPKVVFVETGRIADIVKNIKMEGQLYYTRRIPFSIKKVQYVYNVFGKDYESYMEYLFPIATFHGNWKDAFTYEETDVANLMETNGQKFSEAVTPIEENLIGAEFGKDPKLDRIILTVNEYEGEEIGQIDIPKDSLMIMDNIRERCEKDNIRLIWYTVPYVGDYNYSDAMKSYVNENGGEYINMFEHLTEIGFDSKTDMLDGDHVNAYGAKKITKYLSEYIENN